MEKINYWRLCDELNMVHAALLIIGVDPDELENVMSLERSKRPAGFNAVLSALTNDVEQGDYDGSFTITMKDVIDHGGSQIIVRGIDPNKSTIHVSSIKKWLKKRGLTSDIFLTKSENELECLNTEHPHYSRKLAAAVCAWQAVSSDSSLIEGKTVKQALVDWLNENADKFGFLKDDGEINKQGIHETAKIANWVTKGGAPKTPF